MDTLKDFVREMWGVIVAVVVFLALVCGVVLFAASKESAAYNRLTGADTTMWDAVWLELRVQAQPEEEK